MATDSWVRTAGQTCYKLNLEIDESQLYEKDENGRVIQFYKGKNGQRLITDLGRDTSDLHRAFELLGKNRVDFDKVRKATPRVREGLSVTQEQQTVTENCDTPDKTVTRACVVCGVDISDRRPQVLTCSPACRKKASRTK